MFGGSWRGGMVGDSLMGAGGHIQLQVKTDRVITLASIHARERDDGKAGVCISYSTVHDYSTV